MLGFLVYIPYSKHLHLLVSPFSVFFTSLGPKGALPRSSEGDDEGGGAERLEEFTWRELLNAFACAECGRCDRACPALASGLDLSPRLIVRALKEHIFEVGPGLLAGNAADDSHRALVGELITSEELWACTTCLACMEECPVLNEHLPLIVRMRRHLVYQGGVDQRLGAALMDLSRYGNSFGQSARAQGEWTAGLDFAVKDIREERAEFLWFVGDSASYDPGLQEITRRAA
ncbi:MAG: 4Fe-4S dicluster domain-containing protein, partial [Candidatus Bipolaricaulia bacterium]